MKNEISAADNLIQIISQSRQNALKKVNEELIQMYWRNKLNDKDAESEISH